MDHAATMTNKPVPRDEIARRRTFAIVSHPDAGKTTLTEKFLLYGGALHLAGSVTARKTLRATTSDWMELEKKRGISISSTVLQFDYQGFRINLLDTPGHKDFSEDTYRVLTAVDAAIMVIDAGKGIESQTRKLFEVCRRRGVPIFTFMNKMDRPTLDPLALLDDLENVLGIAAYPMNWPLGTGVGFKGVWDRHTKMAHLYERTSGGAHRAPVLTTGLADPVVRDRLDDDAVYRDICEEIEMLEGAGAAFDPDEVLAGRTTPVYFGAAINNFGVQLLLDGFLEYSAAPGARMSRTGSVRPTDPDFSGFVFKIQANMDPGHRDRIAFMRICSGEYYKGIKVLHVRSGKEMKIPDAITFMAADRQHAETAYAGDIIGIHNHGKINIGDSFTEGEIIRFTGIPSFAPEIFRRAVLKDPLRLKALQKGLAQLCEEGATQLFKPMRNNDLILGAVGPLQFEVVAHRLQHEYKVECQFETIKVATARWVECDDAETLRKFERKAHDNLALDHSGALVYIAPTRVNLNLTEERWPDIAFRKTREL